MRRRLVLLALSTPVLATESEHMEVNGQRHSWLESAQTASEGQVNHEQLQERPILRPGEIMESVPGLITTQHSGTGKANQYFLRGFNLDHGTDFATFVDGIPINMPSHGHGQGYTDVNFLIPEILDHLNYGKGPYAAAYGNFSGAGYVDMSTRNVLPHGLVKYTVGSYDYHRLLVLDSIEIGESGYLSYALEGTRYQGPWSDMDEKLRKKLGWIKFVQPVADGRHTVTLQHYEGSWNAADQIPARAVTDGLINRRGTLDPTTGGRTQRDSLSWIGEKSWGDSSLRLQVYGVRYGLNLWSNLSYFLEDPVQGDQFEQEDRRSILGASARFSRKWSMGTIPGTLTVGAQQRYDHIDNLGLYKTIARQRTATRGESSVNEQQAGVYVSQEWHWSPDFRSTLAVRHDQIQFQHHDRMNDARKRAQARITSPKLTTSYRLAQGLQVFASGGQSFHSNDARGVTAEGVAAPGLVPVRGYEVGGSYEADDALRISLALWRLQLDSELIYIGDAGTTEASSASRREGVDWLLQLAPDPLFHADFELSWARARFQSDPLGEGDQVEGHLPFVAMLGLGSQFQKWSGAARLRYFGKRPLTADGRRQSDPTRVLNLHVAYETDGWDFALDTLNALNSKDHDIDYYYESQLLGETEPQEDLHYHPVEPASLRLHIGRKF
ncbi:TonB-dependent receptor [Oligoflexus tunisiensis]|uniref:TonB-dependent receptor n=1 Tax=Oligoflexus tunisiensis TaxID=708132 RepID=UPI001C402DDA|nr:TonB-dependent receptor [Oligoflexus tunisiensis]